MSFILDALKKSETDRQQRGSAEFAGVPASSGRREGPPAWLWVVAVLLVINLAVLIGILMRPDATPVEPVAEPAARPPATPRVDFASQVATAREHVPAQEDEEETSPDPTTVTPPSTPPAVSQPRVSVASAALPTFQEVQATGVVSLPDLHVDIHVYSDLAKDRFVFINMVKHKEGSRLAEGPLVEEITPDGVVLRQNGTSFLLPRD